MTLDRLIENLSKLVQKSFEQPCGEPPSTSRPLLVGKSVTHKFKDKEYKGRVISTVPGYPEWYNIVYEGDEAVYTFKLLDDYSKGDLKITLCECKDRYNL